MSNSYFHVQLASVMELLSKAAVAQICELVDNEHGTLRLEISRSCSENEVLRRKLQIMEQKYSHDNEDRSNAGEFPICGESRAAENGLPSNNEQDSDWSFNQRIEFSVDWEPKPPLSTGDGLQRDMVVGCAVIKEELLEESTSQREVEGMAGSSAAVADSHLDMDTELTSQPGPQLLTPPSGQQLLCPDPTHNPNPNCDPKTEPESYSIEARPQRTGPSHSGHPRIDYELETEHQQIWTRDCVTETQHTHPIEWADDKERGGEQQLNAHLVHSTLSLPCRSHCSALFLRPRQSCHSTPSAPKSQSNCSTPSSSQSPSKLTSPDFSGFSHSSNHLTLPAKVMPLKKSSKKLKRKKFICSVCGKVLSSECYLKTHLAAHKGKTPYTCAQCGKSFSWYSSLKIHENTHTEWKPYACTLCPKTFGLYCNLKRHQVVHTGERPYRCMQCGKSFITCTQLKIHQNIHTGARPYACTLCPKTFANPGSLTHHKLVHTGEKAHCCTQCGKSFSRAESLKRHQSVHLVKGSSIENSTFQAEKRCPELAHGVVQQS